MRADGSGKVECACAFALVTDGQVRYAKAEFLPDSTIMRAEQMAVLRGLEFVHSLTTPSEVVSVTTDSQIITNYIKKNRERCDTGVWVNTSGAPVANQDLWESIVAEEKKQDTPPEYFHVRGHAGNTFNELCDKLAVESRLNRTNIELFTDRAWCLENMKDNLGIPGRTYQEPEAKPYPIFQTPVKAEVVSGVVTELSRYTDQRAVSCLIKYPDMAVILSDQRIEWWSGENIQDECGVYPVMGDRGELPMKRHRTDTASPMKLNNLFPGDESILYLGDLFQDLVRASAKRADREKTGMTFLFYKDHISACVGDSLTRLSWVGDYYTTRAAKVGVCSVPAELCADFLSVIPSVVCFRAQSGNYPTYNLIRYDIRSSGASGAYLVSSVPVTNVVVDDVTQLSVMNNGLLGNARHTKWPIRVNPDLWNSIQGEHSSSVVEEAEKTSENISEDVPIKGQALHTKDDILVEKDVPEESQKGIIESLMGETRNYEQKVRFLCMIQEEVTRLFRKVTIEGYSNMEDEVKRGLLERIKDIL